MGLQQRQQQVYIPGQDVDQQKLQEHRRGGNLLATVSSRTLHDAGKCKPCAWFWKPMGCRNSAECNYCHICPDGELKARKKSKVAAMRSGALTPVCRSVLLKQEQAGAASKRSFRLAPLLAE